MLARLGKVVRQHPWTTLAVLALLALAATAAGGYVYALGRWRAAEAALREGRPEDARGPLDVCLLVWPRSPRVHLLAARAARLVGEMDAAEAHLDQCLKLEGGASDDVKLEFLLMRVQLGEVDEVAATLFEAVDRGHPETQMILETVAGAYMRNLRYRPALEALERWIGAAPDSATAYHWRGWVRERMNDVKGAVRDYEKALELEPDRTAVRLRAVEILLEESNLPRAFAHLQRLYAQSPERPDVLARLGQYRFLQGRTKEARRLLEAAVERLPDDPLLLIHLARLETQEGRPARAEPWLRRVLAADPSDAEAQYALFTCLRHQGRTEEAAVVMKQYHQAQAVLERANKLLHAEAERPNDDPGPATEIGVALLRVGQERLGVDWLHRALQRDPDHQPAHRALAEHYEKKGEHEKAAAHRRRLTEPATKAAAP